MWTRSYDITTSPNTSPDMELSRIGQVQFVQVVELNKTSYQVFLLFLLSSHYKLRDVT